MAQISDTALRSERSLGRNQEGPSHAHIADPRLVLPATDTDHDECRCDLYGRQRYPEAMIRMLFVVLRAVWTGEARPEQDRGREEHQEQPQLCMREEISLEHAVIACCAATILHPSGHD